MLNITRIANTVTGPDCLWCQNLNVSDRRIPLIVLKSYCQELMIFEVDGSSQVVLRTKIAKDYFSQFSSVSLQRFFTNRLRKCFNVMNIIFEQRAGFLTS